MGKNSALAKSEVINAWRSYESYEDLAPEAKDSLPENPAGSYKLHVVAKPVDGMAEASSSFISDTCSTFISDCCSTFISNTCSTFISDCCS